MTIPPADNASDGPTHLLPPPAPLDGFTAEEFRGRRAALRALCPDGLVLIRGATEDEVPHGAAIRYSQNSTFFYLTGVDTPGAFLILLPEKTPANLILRGLKPEVREILFLPARDPVMEAWTGAKLGPGEECEKLTGVERVMDAGKVHGAVTAFIRRSPVVYTVTPYGEHAVGTRDYALMHKIQSAAPTVQFRDVAPAVAKLRVVKSPAEVDRIREAIAVSTEGQKAARAFLASIKDSSPATREFQLEAEIFRAFRARGGTLAFASIVGGGVNATTLHYEANNAPLNVGDLVVVDIGARVGHYCGDLTRAYRVGGGAMSPRQREIYQLVLDAHEHAVREYKPGQDTLDSMNDRCKEFLKQSPLRAKDGSGKERQMDYFMPHSLGHHLGLDVHDVGDREPPLTPGNVITIEPGIYLPGEGIGVRIEDDYLVTATGLERLGPPLEKKADEVLAAMRS